MQIKIQNTQELDTYLNTIDDLVRQNDLVCTKYINLGVCIVRVLCYTPDVIPLMEKQLTYTLCDNAQKYDSTLIVWHVSDVQKIIKSISDSFSVQQKMRMRLELLLSKKKDLQDIQIMSDDFSSVNPVGLLDGVNGTIEVYNQKTNTCYLGIDNFDPEEFIKRGHIFVQQLNVLIQKSNVNLAHGAIVGYNNNGVLFCARGQRGKSTLTVLSMLRGFEYVSDDYQILEKRGNGLFSYPIYSIITLSPKMYNEMYYDLKGKFVSNNARKDKYVINISDYHNQFRTNYPIKLCIFPEIVSDSKPSIYKCSSFDKGRAIVQLIQSTVMQMRDLNNHSVIKTMLDMVKNKDFYKLDLCRNIEENTEFLRGFLNNYNSDGFDNSNLDDVIVDITFDLANIINTNTCTIYSMNKFATNIYENLLNGFSPNEILAELKKLPKYNDSLLKSFSKLISVITDQGFVVEYNKTLSQPTINLAFADEDNYIFSIKEFAEKEIIELIK